MGSAHPIAWTQRVGHGRAFYSAMGHTAETYAEEEYAMLLRGALEWAADADEPCDAASE